MFKKQNDVENDYNRYNTEDMHPVTTKEAGILGNTIQILIILLLLMGLLIAGVFGYRYLNNEGSIIPAQELASDIKSAVTTETKVIEISKKDHGTKSAVDTQAIVQAVLEKMKNNPDAKSTDLSSEDIAMISNLVQAEVDRVDTVSDTQPVDRERKITKVQSSEKFNSVVVSNSTNEQSELDELSMLSEKIDSAINESQVKESTYTEQISKEVKTRSNEMRVIIVQAGDTLSKIAKRAYGSSTAYDKIFDANPDILRNPNKIYIGQRLRVPQ